jgi:hypothetical protein
LTFNFEKENKIKIGIALGLIISAIIVFIGYLAMGIIYGIGFWISYYYTVFIVTGLAALSVGLEIKELKNHAKKDNLSPI